MRLTVISENTSLDERLKSEHGISIFVEKGNTKLLFDTGYFGAIRANSEKLGIDLSEVNAVAFSHNHVDHCGGFLKIADLINPQCPIYAHKGYNTRKWWDHRFDPVTDITHAENIELVGPAMPIEYFFQNGKYGFRLIEDDVFEIGDGIYLVSNFPQQRGIEAVFPASRMELPDGTMVVDEFFDEQVCVVKTSKGLILLAGCAHNGIMNIIQTVKRHFPPENIYAVIGGMHLVPPNQERINKTIEYLKNSDIKIIGACHCTGPAIAEFKQLSAQENIGSGFVLKTDD